MTNKTKNILLDKFKDFIRLNSLLQNNDSILIAVSGGIDSMVLLNLFLQIQSEFNLKLGIVHINHSLRNNESDMDARFVKSIAKNKNLFCFIEKTKTKIIAKNNKGNLQEVAREIRYDVFLRTAKENNFNKIATAHNKNDNAETVFMNLTRGTGIFGLQGIPIRRENIIRPLMFASRSEIFQFAKINKIKWREDSSNKSLKYTRNIIRNKIFPFLEKQLNQNIIDSFNNISINSRSVVNYFNSISEELNSKIIKTENDSKILNIEELLKTDSFIRDLIFHEVLTELKIEPTFLKIKSFIDAINLQVGKSIELSGNYNLYRERNNLVVLKNTISSKFYFKIANEGLHQNLEIIKVKKSKFEILRDRNIEYINADKIKFPLTFRNWKQSDYFYPLGLGGKKKLSDYFIEQKIERREKTKIPILLYQNKIIWVVGLRLDDRFKITTETKNIYKLVYRKN